MRSRSLAILALVVCAAASPADALKLGVYLQGSKIGQASYESRDEVFEGRPAKRGDSTMSMNTGMLGAALSVEMRATSWADLTGRPIRMHFVTTSGGRTQEVDARFGTTHVEISIESGGAKQLKRLEIPRDARIVDDPLPLVLKDGPLARTTVHVFRPDTASFSKTVLVKRGSATTTLGNSKITATLVEIIDPMATLRVFVGSGGELVKAEGPFGIEMIPEGVPMPEVTGIPDLANASAIIPDKTISNPRLLRRLTIRLSGVEFEALPTGTHQTVRKEGSSWVVAVRPEQTNRSAGLTISEAGGQLKRWVEPDTYMPSTAPRFKKLAAEIVGEHRRVRDAALAVQTWVSGKMKANAGIGVLRDAAEILDTREGVCRDSAILAGTILRAAGVPTRLASGLVNWNGSFYYHAWVEVWDGKRWLGIDPTVPDPQLSASHVKLSHGNVAEAFQFPVLDKVSIQVLHAE